MKKITISALCLFILGCQSTSDVYTPKFLANAANSETTVLKADSEHAHGIFVALDERLYISSINGESTFEFFTMRMSEYPEVVKIPLGQNEIGLRFSQGQIYSDGCVKFIAERDKTYMAKKKKEGRKVAFWVIEEGTNNTVSIPCIVSGS
jgi:hypothetical protein